MRHSRFVNQPYARPSAGPTAKLDPTSHGSFVSHRMETTWAAISLLVRYPLPLCLFALLPCRPRILLKPLLLDLSLLTDVVDPS